MVQRYAMLLVASFTLALLIATQGQVAEQTAARPALAAEQVGICHHTGSASNPVVFITVGSHAVDAHLRHGDTLASSAADCPPAARPFTGVLQANVISGRLDLNGDGVVNGMDDANSLFGSTNVIDGMLDCNAWTGSGAGSAGDNVIDANDDCTLIHATLGSITVIDGVFQLPNGLLPLAFTTPDVRWAAINGLVDSDGNGVITSNDCTRGLIGLAIDAGMGADAADAVNILGSNGSIDPCRGTAFTDTTANGKVDTNNSNTIDATDSCAACFFGRQVIAGVVH